MICPHVPALLPIGELERFFNTLARADVLHTVRTGLNYMQIAMCIHRRRL